MTPEEKAVPVARGQRLGSLLGCLLCAASAIWCGVAPILSASKAISVRSELSSYGNAFIVALLGAGLVIFFRKGLFIRPLLYLIAGVSLLLPALFGYFMLSNGLFLHYTARRVPAEDWQKVVAALEALDKGTAGPYSVALDVDSLPSVLNETVGLRGDVDSGYMLKRGGNGSPFEAFIMYGPKSRRWGVVLGNPTLIPSNLKRLHLVAVTPRLLLFAGID
jgi:hypothetical protein